MQHHALCLAFAGAMLFSRSAAAQPAPIKLHYDAYVSGFNVIDMDTTLALTPDSYRVAVGYRLTGIIGALFTVTR